jgi:hypothetical protein
VNSRRLCGLLLGAAGLALYLWAALRAPVVQWSDSEIDLAWARSGAGILRPVWTPGHAAKPGYLLFLRAALASTGGTARGIVVLESLLLFGSICVSAVLLSRRRGRGVALAFFTAVILFLRIRDAASSVMSEALAAALFLPVAVLVLDPPQRGRAFVGPGLLLGALFLVRPNVGAAALILFAISCALRARWSGLALALAVMAAIVAPFWIATAPGATGDPSRGLTYQMFEASADDYWVPSIAPAPDHGTPAQVSRMLREQAMAHWRETLRRSGPDLRRQLSWRALHGLLGTEFYDARWSGAYRRATAASRVVSPFALLAVCAALLAIPFSRAEAPLKLCGLLLVAALVAQDLVLGSNPRYVLPFLPVLLLFGVCAASSVLARPARAGVALALVLLLVLAVRAQKSVLGWEWGVVECAGATIDQEIPRDALPERVPATLHVRIAAPLVPSPADLEVRAGSRLLYVSPKDSSRRRPEISIALPQDLLDENRREKVHVRLVSTGQFGPVQYLLFPVIPRPWAAPAQRPGASGLSPATGIVSGSLDWWAHSGTR